MRTNDTTTEVEELGAGILDVLRGLYPVADDMPPMYHAGAKLARVAYHAGVLYPDGEAAEAVAAIMRGNVSSVVCEFCAADIPETLSFRTRHGDIVCPTCMDETVDA